MNGSPRRQWRKIAQILDSISDVKTQLILCTNIQEHWHCNFWIRRSILEPKLSWKTRKKNSKIYNDNHSPASSELERTGFWRRLFICTRWLDDGVLLREGKVQLKTETSDLFVCAWNEAGLDLLNNKRRDALELFTTCEKIYDPTQTIRQRPTTVDSLNKRFIMATSVVQNKWDTMQRYVCICGAVRFLQDFSRKNFHTRLLLRNLAKSCQKSNLLQEILFDLTRNLARKRKNLVCLAQIERPL